MADVKISDLTAAGAATGNMQLEVNDAGTSKRVTMDQIQAKVITDAAVTGKLDKSGGTMTGAITLHADPSGNLEAATKQYADTKLPLAGGTMTGALTLSGAPSNNLHAATKQYVDGIVAAQDAMIFVGAIDCSGNPNYPAADRGWTYRVSVAGRIGGGSGPAVEVGDMLICTADSTSTGNHATVGSNWTIVQTNIDGAVIGPASAVSDHFAQFDGTTGKLIKGGKAAPSGAVVGTTDAQTLTGKTISTANNTITAASETASGIVELATAAETLAGTDDTRAATPAGIAGSKSLAANGYYRLPGGLIIQWGIVASGTPAVVTFPIAFPTACRSVTTAMNAAPGSDMVQASAAVINSASQCSIYPRFRGASGGVAGEPTYWIAIGH